MCIINRSIIIDRLKYITDLYSNNIVSLGLISDIFISEKKIFFSITVPENRIKEFENIRIVAQNAIQEIAVDKSVIVSLVSEVKDKKLINNCNNIGIKNVISISSGKGGVGKSTTAINLSIALSKHSIKVGLLDADIYGPSLPKLVGIKNMVKLYKEKIKPIEFYNIKLMSMGFLVKEEDPIIWRGPMIISIIKKMIKDVLWSPLDLLVIDMPPGTGDVPISIFKEILVSGSIIISTPQELSLLEARKSIKMFDKFNIPILGIIENMSYFLAPDTGKKYDIFGCNEVEKEAKKRNIPLIGKFAIDPQIRISSDIGHPITLSDPNNKHSIIYKDIANYIIKKLNF